MQDKIHIQFSPTRLKQMKKIALSGSRAKLKILNGKITEGFQLLKTTAKKFQSFATDLADRIPQALASRISLDLFSHFESKSSKRLGIPKGIVLGGVLALMCSLPVVGQTINATNTPALALAISTANADPTPGIIYLSQGTTFTLTSGLPIVTGTDIGGTLSIICTGTTNAIIDGASSFRPITMDINSNLTLSKITIQNGSANDGGGIYNRYGDLTISDCLITQNNAISGKGGGIFNSSSFNKPVSVLIQNSTLNFNSSSSGGGGLFSTGNISTSIINSTISDNTTVSVGGGVRTSSSTSSLSISSSTISGNVAGTAGGGIYNNSGNISISSSSIIGNKGISNSGGGISSAFFSTLFIQASTIANNQTNGFGAGIATFSGAGQNATTTFRNCTISSNTALGAAGGIYSIRSGNLNDLILQHTTLSNNSGFPEGGLATLGTTTVTLQNSIIANSTGNDFNLGAGGTLTLVTASIVEDGTMAGATSGNPMLNALSGGVHTLQTGSIAIDAASTADATTNDQLGVLRVAPHDIGAVQFAVTAVTCPIDVTSNLDAGVGTLRQAILDANSNISDCVIYLDGGQTYTISSNLPTIVDTAVGGTLQIISTGTTNAIIDGASSFRPLTLSTGSNLTLSKITVQNGLASKGGGIYSNNGILTISNSLITNNVATGGAGNGRGGGIYSTGTLGSASVFIQNSTISLNTASKQGAGIHNRSNSLLTISSSSISGNTSASQGGGIFNYLSDNLSISNSSISGNMANIRGGGIYNRQSAKMSISSSSISGNTSTQSGGGIYNSFSTNLNISSSSISGNTSTTNNGGGIYNRNSLGLSISSSSISGNTANIKGGGIYNSFSANLSISSSSISGNTSNQQAGGIWIYNSIIASIQASSITANQSVTQGGGMIIFGAFGGGQTVTVENTTVSGNISTGNIGGGIYHKNIGGVNNIILRHVTLSDNTGNGGLGTGDGFANNGASSITLQNSIIANSIGTGNDFALGAGTLTLVTATISGDGTLVHTNAITANPMLNVLSGGVHTLQAGSIAIDAASTADATTNDQLGVLRVAPHDIGAVQFAVTGVACPIDVTSNLDAGVGTLRQAILDANSNISNCVIYLDGGQTYTISSNLPIVTGTDIGGKLSIISTGTLNAVIDGGAGTNRPITMDINSNLTLSKITITSGSALKGGAIYNKQGDLTISSCLITNNAATGGFPDGGGGGIYSTGNGNAASVLIQNSTISFNSASRHGAGISNWNNSLLTISSSSISGNTSANQGAGIYNRFSANLSISSSSISGNTSTNRGAGIYNSNSSNLSISSSSISGNTSFNGAGIFNANSSYLSISSSSISGNTSTQSGGGIYNSNSSNLSISGSSIFGNTSTNRGGGIFNFFSSNLSISSSSISENTSNRGAGIYNESSNNLSISSSSISGNTSNRGAGIFNNNSDMTIQASSITLNSATINRGGGIYITSNGTDAVSIVNSTISSNEASVAAGGGIYARSSGGGNTLILQHVTISNNNGTITGGFANNGVSTMNITMQNSIIANNTNADFALGGATLTLVTATISGDGSLIHANAITVDPLLGALTLNSGFLVHPLQVGSPALTAGANIGIGTDQVGNLRVLANPNIGAVEITASSGACMVVSPPTGVTNTWIGCTNTDWGTATNWSTGTVPTATDVVYIPIVAANPLIIDEVATCAKLIVQIGAKCTINYNAGGKLLIKF